MDTKVDEVATTAQQTAPAMGHDDSCQHRERLENGSYDSPEPPEPHDESAQQRSKSPSVELEGESRAASSCDVGPTRDEVDASQASGHVEGNLNVPKKL